MNTALHWLFVLAAALIVGIVFADRWAAEYVDGVGRPVVTKSQHTAR